MNDFWAGVIGVFLLVGIVLGVTWVAQGNDFFLYKHFAPKYAEVQRQTFEQSRAYNSGMAQEVLSMHFEYVKEKDTEAKKMLRSVILQKTADYDLSKLPEAQRRFIEELRAEKLGGK